MEFKIEIRYNSDYEWYELWQHFLNKPKDILFPVSHSNNIWMCDSKKFITNLAIEKFNVKYQQIKFTNVKN